MPSCLRQNPPPCLKLRISIAFMLSCNVVVFFVCVRMVRFVAFISSWHGGLILCTYGTVRYVHFKLTWWLNCWNGGCLRVQFLDSGVLCVALWPIFISLGVILTICVVPGRQKPRLHRFSATSRIQRVSFGGRFGAILLNFWWFLVIKVEASNRNDFLEASGIEISRKVGAQMSHNH